ncbi:MAG: lmo0937 family membrane protein [Bacteroidota bacterium]|nr:lmo0937 family membrane protein [Bacteroidota bacterium]
MSSLLYNIAIVLIIMWLIGYFGFHFGGLIHILLVIALVSVILRLIQGRKL